MKYAIDIQIAIFFKRFFSYYVRKRTQQINKEEQQDKDWLSHFSNQRDSFVHHLSDDIKITLFKDSLLSKFIYFTFEETEITFLKRFLKPGDFFFDIGSNIGLFSLHASPIIGNTGRIYAFEPTPVTFERLQNNIVLNNFQNIKAENLGLSNSMKPLEFHVSNNGYDAWNSVVRLTQLEDSSVIEIRTNTIDNYLAENNIQHVDLIKIDVEGWELNVLKGAANLISRADSPVLMVEFTETNAFAAGYYCGELFDYVKSFGYDWYSFDVEKNTLIPQQKKLHYPYENLIAVKDINACYERLEISL